MDSIDTVPNTYHGHFTLRVGIAQSSPDKYPLRSASETALARCRLPVLSFESRASGGRGRARSRSARPPPSRPSRCAACALHAALPLPLLWLVPRPHSVIFASTSSAVRSAHRKSEVVILDGNVPRTLLPMTVLLCIFVIL